MAYHIYKCPKCGESSQHYGVGPDDVPKQCLSNCGYEGPLDVVWDNFPVSVKTSCKSGSNRKIDDSGLPAVVAVGVVVSSSRLF